MNFVSLSYFTSEGRFRNPILRNDQLSSDDVDLDLQMLSGFPLELAVREQSSVLLSYYMQPKVWLRFLSKKEVLKQKVSYPTSYI